MISKTIVLSAVALASLATLAKSQITLDNFAGSSYGYSLKAAQTSNEQYADLNPPLGPTRYTVFSLGPNIDGQTSTFNIGNGICVVNSGFPGATNLQLIYGFNSQGFPAPLGLNLSGYSAFRLNFQGISTEESLYVNIVVTVHSGQWYQFEAVLPPTPNSGSVDFPFSSVNKPGISPFDPAEIDYIVVEFGGGGSASFGITSFEAV